MYEEAILFVAAVAYVAATVFLNKKIGSRDRLKQLQREINSYQKELKDAAAKNDEKKLKQLSLREKEFTGYMMEMMWLPWKSLIFILPLFFLLIGTNGFLGINYEGILKSWYPDFTIVLPFGLHLPEIFSLRVLSPSVYGPRGFFIVCAVFAGILIELALSRLEAQQAAKQSQDKAQ